MKYPYAVKYNGKYYRPNTEIPEDKPVEVVEKPVESVETEKQEETEEEKSTGKKRTKKD